ncbi:hypothetical protein ACODUL_14940 [Stenotrophomonas maltophilia]
MDHARVVERKVEEPCLMLVHDTFPQIHVDDQFITTTLRIESTRFTSGNAIVYQLLSDPLLEGPQINAVPAMHRSTFSRETIDRSLDENIQLLTA